MQPRNQGLGEIPFCRLAVINQSPLGLLPPGVLELVNYQAEVGEFYYLEAQSPFLSSTPLQPSLKEDANEPSLTQCPQEVQGSIKLGDKEQYMSPDGRIISDLFLRAALQETVVVFRVMSQDTSAW